MGVLAIEIVNDWFGLDGSGQAIGRFFLLLGGVTWIGLLYFFNFVQAPAYPELTAQARSEALRRITYRALWWYRWGAVLAFVAGVWILVFQERLGDQFEEFWGTTAGAATAFGALLGTTMFVNVWTIIWPSQKIVIGSASRVAAGQDPDPRAGEAAKRAGRASRVNVLFSIPLLWYVLFVDHFSGNFAVIPGFGRLLGAWIVFVVLWVACELLAIGAVGEPDAAINRLLFDDHRRTIAFGFLFTLILHFVGFEAIIGTT